MTRYALTSLVAVLMMALAGCGGDGATGPYDGGGSDDGGVKADPSFSADVFPIFTRNGCTAGGCHGTGQAELTMTSATDAYPALVNVPSSETGELRVRPGNAMHSYLVKKLEGLATVGARMPLGGAPLSTADLQTIKNWIDQGAKHN